MLKVGDNQYQFETQNKPGRKVGETVVIYVPEWSESGDELDFKAKVKIDKIEPQVEPG